VDAHVKNLRRKLEPDPAHPRYILTVRGVGYRLMSEAESA
jgi:DNA-binding response OmpR family regulator